MKKEKIYSIIFVAILSIPLFLFIIRVKIEPEMKNERKVSLNFKRNFPLKRDLIKLYTNFKVNILKTNPAPDIVINSNEGWKVLGDKFGRAFSESKGLVVFSKKQLDVLEKNLKKHNDWLTSRNIKYYIAIAPNKLSYYQDLIPIKKKSNLTKLSQLKKICDKLGIIFINLGEKFPKKSAQKLYYKTDTHWTFYGAHYGYLEIMNKIQNNYPLINFKHFKLEDLELKLSNRKIGDLNELLNIKRTEKIFNLALPVNNIYSKKITNKLKIPEGYYKEPNLYENRYRTDSTITQNKLKLMVFNDSFIGGLRYLLNETFYESLFVWNFIYDYELIENEKPNILLHEVCERDIDLFVTNKIEGKETDF